MKRFQNKSMKKQRFPGVLQDRYALKICKIHKKTQVLESLCKIFKNTFFTEHLRWEFTKKVFEWLAATRFLSNGKN